MRSIGGHIHKLFLQTIRHVHKKHMSWCSTFNHIYFPQDSLKDIDRIYKNKIDGVQLSYEDQLLLSKEEFILLHEAGHIEHSDIWSRLGFLVVAFGSLEALRAAGLQHILGKDHLTSRNDHEMNMNLAILQYLFLFPGVVNMLSRYHERNADEFSYSQADNEALVGGISFFEDEDMDPLLNIDKKTVSPFIATNNAFGKLMQRWARSDDQKEIDNLQLINSIPVFRSIYKWMHSTSHPYAADRAQAIKDKLAARQA